MKEVVISNVIERFERGDVPLRQILTEELSRYDLTENNVQGDSDIEHVKANESPRKRGHKWTK